MGDNQVEIRFRVTDEKATPQAATPQAASLVLSAPSIQKPEDYSQRERDVERMRVFSLEQNNRFAKFESRLDYRMRRMGARMVGVAVANEIGEFLGVHDSFIGRLGESAIEGGMMGGPTGAAVRVAMSLIHGLIEKIQGMKEDVARIKEIHRKQEEEAFKNKLDFAADLRKAKEELDDHVYELNRKFRDDYTDYMMNAARYINAPYLGGRG